MSPKHESSHGYPALTRHEIVALTEKLTVDLFNMRRAMGGSSEYSQLRQQRFAELREKLLGDKDRFQHIYKTMSGSLYFLLQSGESFRMKEEETGIGFGPEPVTQAVIFVTPQQLRQIQERNDDFRLALTSEPIQAQKCEVGMVPIEINMVGEPEISLLTDEDSMLTIQPGPDRSIDIYHIGHPISEVVR